MSHQESYQSTCLERVIALQLGCDPTIPTSGLYASSIGISKDFLSQIITKEYSSPLSFFNEKKNFAIDNIVNSIHSLFSPHYKAGTLLKNFRAGHVGENKVLTAGGAYIKGIHYDLCNASSYTDLFINELTLFTDYSGDVDVNVYDLLQNNIIDTIIVPCIAGKPVSVFPAKRYASRMRQLSLFFGYNASAVNSYKTTLVKGCSNCTGSSSYINTNYQTIQAGYFLLADDKLKENFSSSSETGGMSINHSLLCNHSDWLCSLSGLIALPVLYKTGAIIIEFALDESPNTRVNTNVTLNRDILKERLDRYEMKARESLDNILNSMNVPNDSQCFECKSVARHQSFAL